MNVDQAKAAISLAARPAPRRIVPRRICDCTSCTLFRLPSGFCGSLTPFRGLRRTVAGDVQCHVTVMSWPAETGWYDWNTIVTVELD